MHSNQSQKKQLITVLGATGSIGVNTLDVLSRHPDMFEVFALTGRSQIALLAEQVIKFKPKYAVLETEQAVNVLKEFLKDTQSNTELLFGPQALIDVSADSEVNIVMSAIVGAAGLLPTMAAVTAGKKVLLANKEALVMSGELFINNVNKFNAQLIPIDSEHNAIFQCLPSDFTYGDKTASGIAHLLLTGSGGPFRELSLSDFEAITPEQACAHPNWDMGKKISVDSASMMNKGLEFIEAKWLFGFDEKDIQVVLHPQSTIHSMVQYIDGSVIAQLGNPDMRTPIAYGLGFPRRIDAGVKTLDFNQLSDFSFSKPDPQRYPNLYLAIEACKEGQAATTALNAANEIAVEAFLGGHITFTQITQINEQTLEKQCHTKLTCIDSIIDHDHTSRLTAAQVLKEVCKC
ncbi:1-deoxy-D-xylulose-5-phosphate reductoisomerase [Glaciecola petra]|uniref:1-deoxy-D-xylulose 5-phosphate reductoisomerase n=1 Tax=Glaciecola petra TaxID=3075602 RepID=A0ABU2ZM48_9ALTE|nr:1-deoxy-D-xylulose-5-phosphate reductoisomerase [Aestuariibacter sp. P117]MDT0593701.1 1-deoxy-D-xylulose-5-phosphate reductoisomerase [Aestuariibacter sp. P117]